MCREYKRVRRTRSRGSREPVGTQSGDAQGRRMERETKRKKKRMKGVFVRQGRNVRECDRHETSTCVFHSFAILSRSTRRSSVFLVYRRGPFFSVGLYPVTVESDGFFSRHGHDAAAHELGEARSPPSGYSFVRYFSSGTLARQSYSPVALSPTRTVSFNLAHVIQGLLHRRLSLPPIPYSLHVTPDWKVCSAENSLRAQGYTLSRFYIAGQANFGDRTMSGIPVERSPRFIGPILETSCTVRRIFVELIYTVIKKMYIYFLDQSIF